MTHINHIQTRKKILDQRWQIIRLIREFFWSHGFVEVETPLLLKLPGQEPYLSPMALTMHNETKKSYQSYLHTSPEYTMKKMLASGYDAIFTLSKCFRDYESFGGMHNPEFTMIEWYRVDADFWQIMDDTEALLRFLSEKSEATAYNPTFSYQKTEKVHMKEAWQTYAHIDLDNCLTQQSMYDACTSRGYAPKKTEGYEDLFYRIFLNHIEPHLGKDKPTIVHHYPAQMAALAKISNTDAQYAERFELYLNGREIANAFTELTDKKEQESRLKKEKKQREKEGKAVYDIDQEFLNAVGKLPSCAGIALGVDRLIQTLLNCKNIDDVLPLPASLLFE